MSASPSGFALRKNGTCELQEVDCGETVNPYRACCPHASSCPHKYNTDCCPTSANCTQSLLPNPQCANTTWDLYDNDGYFCCLPGLIGYAAKSTNSNGCASPGYEFQVGEVQLRLVRVGESGTVSSFDVGTSTSTTSSSSKASPLATGGAGITVPSLPSTEGGLGTGAKAGIGVGVGVGVLILFIVGALFIRGGFRRRHKSTDVDGVAGRSEGGGGVTDQGKEKEKEGVQHASPTTPELGEGYYHELDGRVRAEVQG